MASANVKHQKIGQAQVELACLRFNIEIVNIEIVNIKAIFCCKNQNRTGAGVGGETSNNVI